MVTRQEAINAKIEEGKAVGLSDRSYQRQGINWLSTVGRCILADDMGIGKSKQAIEASRLLNSDNVLIVCPKTAIDVWKDEIEKWTGKAGTVLKGTSTKKLEKLNRLSDDWYITTYGSLNKIKDTTNRFDTLIFDEAHKLKNGESNRSKFAYGLQRRANHIFMLTGTPIMNTPDEIWSLLHILYPKIFNSFSNFLHEHCIVYFDGYRDRVCGVQNEDKYKYLIEPIILRRLREDCLDLPPIQYQTIKLDMTLAYERFYRSIMSRNANLIANSKRYCDKVRNITPLRYAALLPEHFDFDIASIKLEAAEEIIEGTDRKIVVFSNFVEPLFKLSSMVKRPNKVFYGKLSDNKRKSIKVELNTGDLEVVMATAQSGGESVDFTGASVVIQLDKDWTPSPNDQAIARVYRGGQKEKVHVYSLHLNNTIDDDIDNILRKKGATIDRLINSISTSHKRYIEQGV